MAPKGLSPESIAAVLRCVEIDITFEEATRKAGVHLNTTPIWKKKYGEVETSELLKMNELLGENRRLNCFVAI